MPRQNSRQLIHWVRPPTGFVKINSDASLRSNGKIGFGVVVRDANGCWIRGICGHYIGEQFDKHVGPNSGKVVQGELKAIEIALLVARESRFKNVIVESDSKIAIDLINHASNMDRYPWLESETAQLILTCRELSNILDYCIFQHQKREGNFCADKLAELGVKGNETVQCFKHPPHQLLPYLMEDHRGFSFVRGIKPTTMDILTVCDHLVVC